MRQTVIGIVAVLVTAAPALAGPEQDAAVAYCASRTYGGTERDGLRAAASVINRKLGFAYLLVNRTSVNQQLNYHINQTCPQFAQ